MAPRRSTLSGGARPFPTNYHRALLAAGKEQEAVEFCMGWEPGTSNAHFGAWTGPWTR
ncbi:hypothetical protein ABZ619_28650 [Streptomyces sp. NPDC007851]|uniref:hypothetical protein n=1 Tax=Streptomyces sp. NPDC007851 TaxID=3155008 RepID=UPI0033DC9C7B